MRNPNNNPNNSNMNNFPNARRVEDEDELEAEKIESEAVAMEKKESAEERNFNHFGGPYFLL